MSASRGSVKSFLSNAKNFLRTAIANGQKLTFVIGNESADLDSMTSSLLLAYLRSASSRPSTPSRLYVPLVNIPRPDLSLRSEFGAVLRHAEVSPEDLITLDDLPTSNDLATQLKSDLTSWILVDHNVLLSKIGSIYASRVVGVIDHHDDEHKVPEETRDEPRIIIKAGSCTSLVVNHYRNLWDDISRSARPQLATTGTNESQVKDETADKLVDAQLAQVALASILIDTANLKDENKVTEHDIEAVQYLEAKIMASIKGSNEYDRDRYYRQICDAKHDVGGLQLCDNLRKDYKQWTEGSLTLGISSVVRNIDFLIHKAADEQSCENKSEAFLRTMSSFIEDRRLDLFSIMTTSTSSSGKFERELFLFARSLGPVQAAKKFETQSSTELGLAEWHGCVDDIDCTRDGEWRRIWRQRNVQHSRKQVAPLLRKAMNG